MEEKRKLKKARLKQAQKEGRQGKVRGGKCTTCRAKLLGEHIVQCIMCENPYHLKCTVSMTPCALLCCVCRAK